MSSKREVVTVLCMLLCVIPMLVYVYITNDTVGAGAILSKATKANHLETCSLRSIADESIADLIEVQSGKRYVLQVFSTWCPHCTRAHDALMTLKANNVPVFGILRNDNAITAKDWLLTHGNPYLSVGVDDNGSCLARLGVQSVPSTFVIDEEQNIVFHSSTSAMNVPKIMSFFNESGK